MADVTTVRGATPGDPLNQPINKSSDYLAMVPYWDIVDVLLGGVEDLRAEGTKYLPRFQNEKRTTDPDGQFYDPYEQRRAAAPLTNIFEDIVFNLSSKPFSHEVKLDQDWADSEPYTTLAENIDGMGNNLHTFAEDLFKTAVEYSITWILVDFTQAAPRPDNQPLSIAEESAQGLRPYWVHINPTMLYAVYSDTIRGNEEIVHARIFEPTLKLDGYIERIVRRVRVFQREAIAWDIVGKPTDYGPPQWLLYEETIDPGQDTGSWALVEQGVLTIDVIPLVPVITGKRIPGSWQIRPPMQSIAYLQIEEYQQESNLKTVLELAAFPMLTGNGITKDANGEKIPLGPRTVLFGGSSVDGQPGSWSYLEPAGSSIAALQTQLEKTRNEMRDLGKQPLTLQNQTVVTTAQIAVKANSAVQAWALRLKDALEQAWVLTAKWLKKDDEPEVFVYTDFNVALDTGQGWAAIFQLRGLKDISRETAIQSAVRYGYLPENFDMKQDEEQLATEAEQAQLQAEQQINPVTGQPIAQGQSQPSGQRGQQESTLASDFQTRTGRDRFTRGRLGNGQVQGQAA